MEVEPQTTLRDDLAAQFDALEQPAEVTPAPEGVKPDADPIGETAEQKAGRLAGRARDEKGRVLPGKPVKEAAKAPEPAPAPAAPPQAAIKRPSSWKKDHWESFDKLAAENPNLAQYINQREQEFSSGVSTYKQVAERAQPLLEAIAPFEGVLQQHGIKADQWISNLGNAHLKLAQGSPQDKIGMMQKLVSDYGIPAQLAVQGQDGQWQLLGAYQAPQTQQPQFDPSRIEQLVQSKVQEQLQSQSLQQQIQAMESDTTQYPYFTQVRETMAGLLQSGLATSLGDAYQAALRLPQHNDIFEAMQKQQREADEAARREAEQARVHRARSQTVSTRSSTPSGAVAAVNGKKSLRDELSEQFDVHSSGRV